MVSTKMGSESENSGLRHSIQRRPTCSTLMNLSEYQQLALRTDKAPATAGMSEDRGRLIPLLGLAGEAGELLAEYKKRLRDGPGHVLFVDRVAEELGDILWYVANLASKYDLSLDDLAMQ